MAMPDDMHSVTTLRFYQQQGVSTHSIPVHDALLPCMAQQIDDEEMTYRIIWQQILARN